MGIYDHSRRLHDLFLGESMTSSGGAYNFVAIWYIKDQSDQLEYNMLPVKQMA